MQLERTPNLNTEFPLYLYPKTTNKQTIKTREHAPLQSAPMQLERTPNLNAEIVKQIAEKLGLTFTNIQGKIQRISKNRFSACTLSKTRGLNPLQIQQQFWKLVKLGGEIRQIHLLESPIVEDYITQYPINGNNVVGKPHFVNSSPLEGCPQGGVVGKVYINYDKTTHSENGELQYFSNVPLAAWEFYIGGYQPAQKWLKDRKVRTLNFEDILHYQKIIVALSETNRLMKEIDKIDME